MQKKIANFYIILAFIIPLIFSANSSEIFELPKMVSIYLITILIVSLWGLRIIAEKKLIFKRTLLDLPLIIFLTVQLVSASTSIDLLTSLQGYYSRFYGGVLSLAAFSLLYWGAVSNLKKENLKTIVNALLLSTAIVSVWAIAEKLGASPSCLFINGEFNVSCWSQKVQERPFATIGQPNWLASFLAMTAPLVWAKLNINKQKIPYFLLSILIFLAILFTASRSGILGFSMAFIIYWVYELSKFRIAIVNFRLFILLLSACLFLGMIYKPFSLHTPENPDPTVTSSVDIRILLWQGALDIWKENPWLGTGPETFAYSYYQHRPFVHNMTSEWNFVYNKAHNEYLNYLANTGVIGLASYLTLIVFSIRQINRGNIHYLAGFISLLVANFFSFSTTSVALLFFLFPAFSVVNNKNTFRKIKLSNMGRQWFSIIVLVIGGILIFYTMKFYYSDRLYSTDKYNDVNKATTLSPFQPQYWEKMGEVLVKSDSDVLADMAFQKALELAPRNIKLQKNVVQQYLVIGNINENHNQKALSILEPLVKLAPTDPMLPYFQALAYMNSGDPDMAREMLSRALLMRPQYREAQEAFLLIEAAN